MKDYYRDVNIHIAECVYIYICIYQQITSRSKDNKTRRDESSNGSNVWGGVEATDSAGNSGRKTQVGGWINRIVLKCCICLSFWALFYNKS